MIIDLYTPPQTVSLKPGLVISKTCKVRAASVTLPSADETGRSAAITIRGNNITVDFAGSTLYGTPGSTEPDKRKGTAVRVEGKNITILNLKAHGYKVGLFAKDSSGLRVVNSDFSYNWKQHLASTLDREDLGDWMSYHHNEKDEWLQYGAGIYLRNCDGFEVRGTKIEGGQCGLMITGCDKGKIWNNSFSFLSGIGLGMYRSSGNEITHNNIDWCVRGYSHGVYNRGQDSAGILIYEQSHKNLFAFNSVTHGGDGFFLWAGQSTMDNGQGGCNDNVLYGNDFSHAPTNGIEATFSRNDFINNLILECWHGVWGGYSYDTRILGNVFGYNVDAIAIEHGQNNKVEGNAFIRDETGLRIWQNPSQDPNWGYPKNRDTVSHDYSLRDNFFDRTYSTVLDLRDTKNFNFGVNTYRQIGGLMSLKGDVSGFKFVGATIPSEFPNPTNPALPNTKETITWPPVTFDKVVAGYKLGGSTKIPALVASNAPDTVDAATYAQRWTTNWNPLVPSPKSGLRLRDSVWSPGPKVSGYAPHAARIGGRNPFLKPGQLRGRRYILIDEWGPYDFKSPILWPRGPMKDNVQNFEVLGPKGRAKVARLRGARIVGNPTVITVPGAIKVAMNSGLAQDVLVELEYSGGQVTTPFGQKVPAGKPYKFRFTKFFLPLDWTVRFFGYDGKTQDPREHPDAYQAVIAGTPLRTDHHQELNLAWGGSPGAGVPNDHFATVAETEVQVPAGTYDLNITSDDGVRVFLDGKVILEDWTWHAPKQDKRTVRLGGKHKIRIEHFELDGYSALKCELVPKR